MALIQISDTIAINSDKIDSIESKGEKIWISIGTKSYTIDIPISEFLKKIGTANQSSGGQHFAG